MSQSMLRRSVDVQRMYMFVILFDMLLNPSFKVKKSVANIEQQLEQQLAQVNLYARKDFKSLGIGSLLEK